MKQLTLRGFDDELAGRLRQVAEEQHISLNKAVLRLLRKATGLDAESALHNQVGNRLDTFIGCWSEEEERDFNQATQVFEEIDPELWS